MAKEKKIDMVILGLLSHEDLTGYDIKKRIDGAVSFFWKGSFGNIYPALKDMESAGFIEKTDSSVGGRERIVYHISKSGKEQLVNWLNEEQAANELRYETLLKLFFGAASGRKTAIRNIEAFERQIEDDLKILKLQANILKRDIDDEDHLYYYLTASFGIDTYEAYLKWCTKAKRLLEKQT